MSQTPTAPSSDELETLQRELSDRRSIVHLAHAGVSFVVALILGLAAGKLFWDSIKLNYLGVLAAALSAASLIYALVHYARARRLLESERQLFEQMKQLRQALHLDDPSALLPQ